MKLAGSKTDDVEWLIPLWSHEEPSQVKVNSPSSNRSLKFLTVCYLFLLICTSLLTWKAIILVLNLTPQPLPSAAQPVKKQVVLPATSFFDVPEVSQLVFNRNLSQTDSCWEVSSRFDCHPSDGASQERCEERGCCWREPDKQGPTNVNSSNNGLGSAKFGHLGVPLCFYPIGYSSYRLIDYHSSPVGHTGLIQRKTGAFDVYPNPVELLEIRIILETATRFRVQILQHEKDRYQVPFPKLPDPPAVQPELMDYEISVVKDPFALRVLRKSGGEVLFDTSASGFSFYDQFIEISSFLPSRFIYGLGEHSDRLLHPTDYTRLTFFATDAQPGPNMALYGAHPFYLSMEEDGRSHGVLLFNSNAMDVILSPAPAITYRTIGGILDFSFFLGPSPKDVVAQYIELIGKPALPPYWALGFQLCKYGYGSLNRTKAVMERNIAAGIPLDVQWNDIDYMDKGRDFTIDPVKFFGLSRFVHSLHERGMHYMIITDPGISAVEEAGSYPPYDDGVAMDCFVKNSSGGLLEGQVWTGDRTVFPDFTHPNATEYWTKQIVDFHGQIGFDGLWIDMNEPSNFVDGSVVGCPASSLEQPPYLPHVSGKSLNFRTICMTAQHFLGKHYDLHNIYGLTEAMATQKALVTARLNRRPLIISRSTAVGQGKYSSHWTGDVPSTWEALQRSIPNMLNFNMFGIPLVGADICGFNGNTTVELCQRWQELGAFYPFSRNHNSLGMIDQDPAAFSEAFIASSRMALLVRYQLLPLYYTLFFRAALNGTTVVRPLFFEFPNDRTTYQIDWQFLIGESLMVSPVLSANTTHLLAYFPKARWYDFYTGVELETELEEWVDLAAPLDKINLHIRGGAILPTQKPETTTTASRLNPFKLLITLDEDHEASGELFWDDGEQFDALEQATYTHVLFRLNKRGLLQSTVEKANYSNLPNLEELDILGSGKPHNVLVNGIDWPFLYDKEARVLKLLSLKLNLLLPFRISFVY